MNLAQGSRNLVEEWKFWRRQAGGRREDGRQELWAKRRIDIVRCLIHGPNFSHVRWVSKAISKSVEALYA